MVRKPSPDSPGHTDRFKIKGLVVVAVFFLVWALPVPGGLSDQAWLQLSLFLATIVGLILCPIPMGGVVLIGLTVSVLSGAVPYREALTGFANGTIWLIVVAFLLARAFIITGLGKRIAFHLIRRFGSHTLGLTYSIAAADLILAPATPSNTARAGGILYPIVRALALSFDSTPERSPRRIGAYLIKTQYQCNLVTSAMFMTSMAANPLAVEFASKVAGVEISWGTWALAGLLPGIVSLAVIPLFLYRIYPPEIKRTPQASELARRELQKMGKLKRGEKILLLVFCATLTLWATSQLHGINTTTVAFSSLSLLLATRVMSWNDVLGEKGAWDALVWFGGLVMMAGRLNDLGVIGYFAGKMTSLVGGMPWMAALIVLVLIYIYAHYGLASQTAHVTAMYPAFLATAVAAGAPPYLAALLFGFFSNLNASLTHYAAGPAVVYFGSGYVEMNSWWRLGLLVSLINTAIWFGIGFPYWKFLGLW